MANPIDLSPERARAVLLNILEAMETSENAVKIGEAKDNAGNDMVKVMQYVFPLIVQIQMDVIKQYGFPEGREGIVQFLQLIRTLEKEDQEVAHLHARVRAHYLAPITINTETSS